jgi:signal transduction histidine kinase/streptogramin lyase
MCEDDAGAMWFGTYQGISSYDQKQKPFSNYLYQANNLHGLSRGDVLDIREDVDGGLWIATHGGGLNYLPYGSKSFSHFRHVPTDPASLSTDMLLCMSGNSKDILWIGGRGGGLMKFDKRTKKTKRFFHDPNDPLSLSENTIFYLYEDRKGNLWIGTGHEGVDKLDPVTEKFVHYRNISGDSASLSGNAIWSIIEDDKGFIWIGTQRTGLNRLDPWTGKCTRYVNRQGDPKSIRSNSIYALHEYPQGVLWIGTAGGLNRFDEKTNEFTAYTQKDGLAGNEIASILHDARGRLWLASKLLSMLDPQKNKIKNFDEGDGIRCGAPNQEAACVGRDGRMYFGGADGFVVFHPDSIYENLYIPPVVMTNFKVFENSRPFPEDATAGIILSYEENYFSFEFAALSYTSPEKNMYRYMLEGYDKNWISCGTRRYAAYTHVDPGDYVFKVQGSNDDGVWNTTGTTIAVHVIPPFWKTLWFRISIIVIVLFAVAIIIHRRFKFLEQRTRNQQELSRQLLESQENERKRIGIGLHDSLGQNLLVIKNLAVMGLEAGRKKKTADEQLGEISILASQALAEVREISYDLRPHHLDQLGLTGALKSIISRISSSSQFIIHDNLDDVNNLFPKQEEINVFRIVQESVSNIIKHSRATSATITVKRNGDNVTLIVSDNGIGFDHHQHGFGLTGMAERARILGGTLEVKSLPGSGTTISVMVPLKGAHAKT